MVINKTCPSCKKTDSIQLINNKIECTNNECDFFNTYQCPICNSDLEDKDFQNDSFICSNCTNSIPTTKIKYLIENRLYIDYEKRCLVCNAPTIHKKEINLSHRCFFFPQCSGQTSLFGTKNESLVFLDLETTGLDIGKDSITEIGALKIDKDGNEHTFQSFVKPLKALLPHITELTGITNEMLVDAPQLSETINKFAEFIGDAKIVSHNADFDIPWLLTATLRHNVNLLSKDVICTLAWARMNQEGSSSLGALSKKYNISHNNAHRALSDAVTTKELFFIFKNNKNTKRPVKSLDNYKRLAQNIVDKYPDFIQ